MKILCQRDSKWANILLGPSQCTVGRYGCTTTDISMGLDYFGKFKDPGVLAKTLSYTTGGLILWDSLSKVGLKLDNRFYGIPTGSILAALKNPNQICLLEVDHNHWLLATGKSIFGGYNVADPWFGDRSTTRRYENNITGGAIISKI